MRPLSSLTKEITVEGYNAGIPFVPIDELNRILKKSTSSDCQLEIKAEDIWIENIGILGIWEAEKILSYLYCWHFWLWDQSLFSTGDIIEIKD